MSTAGVPTRQEVVARRPLRSVRPKSASSRLHASCRSWASPSGFVSENPMTCSRCNDAPHASASIRPKSRTRFDVSLKSIGTRILFTVIMAEGAAHKCGRAATMLKLVQRYCHCAAEMTPHSGSHDGLSATMTDVRRSDDDQKKDLRLEPHQSSLTGYEACTLSNAKR